MKVLFLQGIPGSGKSTFAKKFCKKNKDWVRVCRDDLRNMRGEYWLREQEDMITDWEKYCILGALQNKKNVIIDATNLNIKYRNKLIEFINDEFDNVQFETKFFDVPVKECIKRDLKRPNSVGEKVIRKFYDKYLKPDIKIKQNSSLPHAIIVDLDGTLAIHNGRSPYEYDKCDTDLVNEPIAKIVEKFYNGIQNQVIFMSGREDSCNEKTFDWLQKIYGYPEYQFQLFMRKTGDHRPDYIVKKELFEQHVKDKYYVDFVLDDRNQVVQLWRDLGLTCLQVADGEF